MGFNDNLKLLLKDRNLKQADLCRMTGIQTSLMSDYLGGKKSPTIGNAILIADALNISLDTLVGKDTYSTPGEQQSSKMTTGQRMKAKRKEIGLSAEIVAKRSGVSPVTIYRYENGDIDQVPEEKLAPIAAALQTTPAYLTGWDENNPPAQMDERIWKTICADSAKLELVTWIAGLDHETFRRMEKILDAAFDL